MRCLFVTLALGACAPSSSEDLPPDDDTSDAAEEPLGPPSVCENPPASACGEPGSVITGRVALPDGHRGPTSGNLVIYLNHASVFGNPEGGGFLHYATRLPGVELAEGPVEFALDMCQGGAMWSEHNCGYALIGILDQNGNNDFELTSFSSNPVPDPGEPAFRVELDLSCDDTVGHCVDVELDCRGPDCASGEDAGVCACDTESTCVSIAAGCI